MSRSRKQEPSLFDGVPEPASGPEGKPRPRDRKRRAAGTRPKGGEKTGGARAGGKATSMELARAFVRWCCSFGAEFRNSPDATNLKRWARGEGIQIQPAQQGRVIANARDLYQKRVGSMLRKSGGAAGRETRADKSAAA